MSDILVVTCPSGKQCAHLLPLIYKQGRYQLRLAAHSKESQEKLKAKYPDAEVVEADITKPDVCQQLLRGATAVYHVGPSFHSREKEMGLNMVDAAVTESQTPGSAFQHFVFSSVLNTQHRQLMQHDLKSYIEERLMISPLQWTILKPTNFMDAYPVQLFASMEKPFIEKLWTPEIPNSVIALRDLAEASAKVLNEGPKHYLAEYGLCSTMPVSDADIVRTIGKAIGKDIEIRTPTFETGVNKVMMYLFGGKASNIYAGDHAGDFKLAGEGDLRGDICRDEAERLVLFVSFQVAPHSAIADDAAVQSKRLERKS